MVPPTPAHQMNYTLVPSGSEGDEEDENAFNAMLEPDNSNIMDNGIAVRISDDDGDDDLVPPPLHEISYHQHGYNQLVHGATYTGTSNELHARTERK